VILYGRRTAMENTLANTLAKVMNESTDRVETGYEIKFHSPDDQSEFKAKLDHMKVEFEETPEDKSSVYVMNDLERGLTRYGVEAVLYLLKIAPKKIDTFIL